MALTLTKTTWGGASDKSGATPLTLSTTQTMHDGAAVMVAIAQDSGSADPTTVRINNSATYDFTFQAGVENTGGVRVSLWLFNNLGSLGHGDVAVTSIDAAWSSAPTAKAINVLYLRNTAGTGLDINLDKGVNVPNTGTGSGTSIAIATDAAEFNKSLAIFFMGSEDSAQGWSHTATGDYPALDQWGGTTGQGATSNIVGGISAITDNNAAATPNGNYTIDSGDWAAGTAMYIVAEAATVTGTALNQGSEVQAATVGGKGGYAPAALEQATELLTYSYFPRAHPVLSQEVAVGSFYNVRTNPTWEDVTESGALGGHAINRAAINADPPVSTTVLNVFMLTQEYDLDVVNTIQRVLTQEYVLDAAHQFVFTQEYDLDALTSQLQTIAFTQEHELDSPSGQETWAFTEEHETDAPAGEETWAITSEHELTGVTLHQFVFTREEVLDAPVIEVTQVTMQYRLEPTYTTYGVHEAPAKLRMAQHHEAPYTWSVAQAHEARWSTRVTQVHQHDVDYRVSQSHEAPAPFTVARILQDHEQQYAIKNTISVAQDHSAGSAHRVAAEHQAPYPITLRVLQDHTAPILFTVDARQHHQQIFDIKSTDSVAQQHVASAGFSVDTPTSSLDPEITISGVGISPVMAHIGDVSISQSEGDTRYVCDVQILDESLYYHLALDTEFAITLRKTAGAGAPDTDVFHFIVDARNVDHTLASGPVMSVRGVSKSAKLAFPRATPIDVDIAIPTRASSIASSAVTGTGVSVTWSATDWTVEPSAISMESASPMQVIQSLADAILAQIEADRDGNLVVRNRYPVLTTAYASSVDKALRTDLDVFRANSALEPRTFYNSFEVGDRVPDDPSDMMEWIPDEVDPLKGRVRVYPNPWRPGLSLSCTANGINISGGGQRTEQQTETIEFAEGVGSVQYPIYSIQTVSWNDTSLGGYAFDDGFSEIRTSSADNFYSMADVTYTKRFLEYDIIGDVEDNTVQFILIDSNIEGGNG